MTGSIFRLVDCSSTAAGSTPACEPQPAGHTTGEQCADQHTPLLLTSAQAAAPGRCRPAWPLAWPGAAGKARVAVEQHLASGDMGCSLATDAPRHPPAATEHQRQHPGQVVLYPPAHLLELSIEPLPLRRPLALDALQLGGRLAHLLFGAGMR